VVAICQQDARGYGMVKESGSGVGNPAVVAGNAARRREARQQFSEPHTSKRDIHVDRQKVHLARK